MSTKLDRGVVSHADAFSIATLLYARLRRTVRLPRSVIVLGFPLEHVDYQIHQSP